MIKRTYLVINFTIRSLIEILFYIILMILEILTTLNAKSAYFFSRSLIKRTVRRYKIFLKNSKCF